MVCACSRSRNMHDRRSATLTTHDPPQLLEHDPPDLSPQRLHIAVRAVGAPVCAHPASGPAVLLTQGTHGPGRRPRPARARPGPAQCLARPGDTAGRPGTLACRHLAQLHFPM